MRERFGDLIFSTGAHVVNGVDSDEQHELVYQGEDRTFPISLVFHTIVTLCCWFMNYQMQRRNSAVKQVLDMKKVLQNAERNATTTATTATSTSAASSGAAKTKKKKTKTKGKN